MDIVVIALTVGIIFWSGIRTTLPIFNVIVSFDIKDYYRRVSLDYFREID